VSSEEVNMNLREYSQIFLVHVISLVISGSKKCQNCYNYVWVNVSRRTRRVRK
jgi:hypothetical protein